MTLDLQALSITKAFNTIRTFFTSQENNSNWNSLNSGSEGLFFLRMISNLFSNISYKIITARRENFLTTANIMSSNIGIAVNLGYSTYRGSNLKRKVTISPTNNYTLEKLSVLGSYDDEYDIITLDNISLVSGTPIEIRTVIGKVKTVSFTVNTVDVKPFTQFTTGISEDYILYLGTEEVPTSKVVKDLSYNKYLVRTNPYGSVDVMYLNNAGDATYKYTNGSEFTIKYVELADVPVIPFTDEMFSYGTLLNTITTNNYIPAETVGSIKVNAPLDHETQNLIRSKEDYTSSAKKLIPNIIQTNYTPITPTYTLFSYLKDDYTLLNTTEYEYMESLLATQNFFGTPLPDVVVPRRQVISLDINLKLNTKYKDISDVTYDVQNILENNYNTLLSQAFDTYTLERTLEDSLTYVKYARVNYHIKDRDNETAYQLGDIIENNNVYYLATSILNASGGSEPNWNVPVENTIEIDTGLLTTDAGIYWRTYKKLDVEGLKTWQSTTRYKIGDYVSSNTFPNYMFKCVDFLKSSGYSTPVVTNTVVGDFIIDGSLVWVKITYNPSLDDRVNLTSYQLGSSVNIGTSSFQCVSYVGKSGVATPNYEQLIYDVESYTTNIIRISGNMTAFFNTGDVIKITLGNGFYNSVVSTSSYDSATNRTLVMLTADLMQGMVPLKVSAKRVGTVDGDILWTALSNVDEIKYDWNVYNTIGFNLEVS